MRWWHLGYVLRMIVTADCVVVGSTGTMSIVLLVCVCVRVHAHGYECMPVLVIRAAAAADRPHVGADEYTFKWWLPVRGVP